MNKTVRLLGNFFLAFSLKAITNGVTGTKNIKKVKLLL
jgi:hypothetical protein